MKKACILYYKAEEVEEVSVDADDGPATENFFS